MFVRNGATRSSDSTIRYFTEIHLHGLGLATGFDSLSFELRVVHCISITQRGWSSTQNFSWNLLGYLHVWSRGSHVPFAVPYLQDRCVIIG